MSERVRIRYETAAQRPVLEALQRRSSDVWEAYREQLALNSDAIELPQTFIDSSWVRVAVNRDDMPIGFSVVIPTDNRICELDGLFVEPAHMQRGIGVASDGRSLRARRRGRPGMVQRVSR